MMRFRFMNFMNRFLSLSSLSGAYLVARLAKYYFFGVGGFGRSWRIKVVGFWDHVEFIRAHILYPYLLVLIVAMVIDYFFWPYVFKKETKEIKELLA